MSACIADSHTHDGYGIMMYNDVYSAFRNQVPLILLLHHVCCCCTACSDDGGVGECAWYSPLCEYHTAFYGGAAVDVITYSSSIHLSDSCVELNRLMTNENASGSAGLHGSNTTNTTKQNHYIYIYTYIYVTYPTQITLFDLGAEYCTGGELPPVCRYLVLLWFIYRCLVLPLFILWGTCCTKYSYYYYFFSSFPLSTVCV